MNEIKLTRRAVLTGGSAVATFFILGAAPIEAAESAGGTCADPNQLSGGARSLRVSVEYKAESTDKETVCANCAFFELAADSDQCGNCIIVNGVVDAPGYCISWSPKGWP